MKRLPVLVLLAGLGAGAGATALAQDGGTTKSPYQLPEPSVRSSQVLRLPASAPCADRPFLKVRITPPPGAVLAFIRVRAAGGPTVEMTGVPRAASASVRLPSGGGTVAVSGETLGGQTVSARRTYGSCARRRSGGNGGAPRGSGDGTPVVGGGDS